MKRILILATLIIGSCATPSRTINSNLKPTLPTQTVKKLCNDDVFKKKFGFSREKLETPDVILSTELADPNVYPITTRIVIEGQPVSWDENRKEVSGVWWARKIKDVKRDLANTEKLYKDVGIKFIVTEISYREFNPNMVNHFVGAAIHKGVLTITYMLPNGFAWEGYSSGPWEPFSRGIVLSYLSDEWVLAHEVGHYFGLIHPFDDDFLEDTPEQKQKHCVGKELSTPNCHNIMIYCNHTPKTVTPGQIDRFKRFLRAKRIDHFDEARPDILSQTTNLPISSSENSVDGLPFITDKSP